MFRHPARSSRLVVSVFAAVLAVLSSLALPVGAIGGTQVFHFGSAPFHGDLRNSTLNSPIVDFAATPSGGGYWELAADGGIFTFGTAQFHGSTGSIMLNAPIVALASSRTGNGYFMLGRDGGVFAFGDAFDQGSVPNPPGTTFEYTDIAVDPVRGGYWVLRSDGAVTAFGSIGRIGRPSTPGLPLGVTAVAIAPTPTGDGYTVAYSDGRTDVAGDAADAGSATGAGVVDMAADPDGTGVWLVRGDGTVEGRGVASLGNAVSSRSVVSIAAYASDGYWVANAGNGPNEVTGRVVDDLGNPVAGLCVQSIDAVFRGTSTDADGRYLLLLPDGTHRIRFGGCLNDDRYVSEYYKDAATLSAATWVNVEGTNVALDEVGVERTGTIAGVVRDSGGQLMSTACVMARNVDGTLVDARQVRTTVTGYYRIGGLRNGSYVVDFNDCVDGEHVPEYYDDVRTLEEATPVAVTPGAVRDGINAQLARAGAITGTVQTADGGTLGFTGACVQAYDDRGAIVQQANIQTSAQTGAYRLKGLSTGAYKIRFNSCLFGPASFGGPNDYVDEWWNDQPTDATAAPVAVTEGSDTSGISAVVARAGSITGSVTMPNGAPVGFHCVDAVQGETSVRRTTTNMSGAYQLRGLRPGSYSVRFGGCTGGGNVATEWWPNSATLAASTPVALTTGQQQSGIDAVMDPAGFLEGQVNDANGNGVRACVEVHDEAVVLATTLANHNGITGSYRVGGLNNNSYKIRFTDCTNGAPGAFGTEWFQDSATKAGATPVAASAGSTTTVPTAVVGPESVISGVVTSPTGAPVGGVCIRTYTPDGADVSSPSSAITTVTGFYRVTRLAASTYKVRFDTACGASGYVSEWWDDKASLAEANAVTTTAGATTANVNAVLSRRTAAVPGSPASVTATGGRGTATVGWTAVPETNGWITGYRVTSSNGAVQDLGSDARSATFNGLAPGSYTFTVQARNVHGLGGGTTSNAVTVTGPPGAPGRPSTTVGNGSVGLSWSAGSDNGEAITEYVVTASTDGAELRVPGTTRSATFARPNGVSVSFTVRAINGAGTGPASAASDVVTPMPPPPPPPPPPPSVDPDPTGEPEPVTAGSSEIEPLPAGSQVEFSGSGFKPFEPGDVIINSTPRKLASFVTDANGSFSVLVTIPEDMELGSHTLVATSKAPDGTVRKLSSPVVVVPNAASTGYRLLAADGGIFTFGDAGFFGSAGGTVLRQPIVAGATTPSGDGYWLVGADGAVFTFGDANFFGSLGGTKLNKPIVGMASTSTGKGYWLVASDGGMFAFGDAGFHGSTGALVLNKPIVGMTASPTGKGYWLVATDGGIFAFGDAAFFGSTGDLVLNKPIVGMTASPTGQGYWLVASDGGIFSFGDAGFHGSTGAVVLNKPIVGMAASPKGDGYRLVASDGGIFAFGDAAFLGSTGDLQLSKPILALL